MNIIMDSFNLFTPIFLAIGVVLGITLGVFLSKPRKNQVFKILPNDNRGYDFDIIEENAYSVYAKGFDTLPDQRFIKYASSILTKVKKRFGKPQVIARYIGKEGTAYTQKTHGKKIKNIPLDQVLKTLWGLTEYEHIPEPLKALVEKGKIGITIGLEETPLTPLDPTTGKPMSPMSEEDVKKEEDRAASHTFWQGKALQESGQWIRNIAWMGFGAGVILVVALLMNWIQLAK